jgi:hypothetical protein
MLGMKIKEQVDGFKPKQYGHSTLGKIMNSLGYKIDKTWCYPQQKQSSPNSAQIAATVE